MPTSILLIISVIFITLWNMGASLTKKHPPPRSGYDSSGTKLYEWGKPENRHQPKPDVYEFKMGYYEKNKAEHQYSTFRIEKEFIQHAAPAWGNSVDLVIPLAVLDKKQTAEQYIQNYDNAKRDTYQVLAISLRSSSRQDIPIDKNNMESLVGSIWYGFKSKLQRDNKTCINGLAPNNRYHFCDIYNKDKIYTNERYYWAANPHNVDPVMQMPIIFQCDMNHELCDLETPYKYNTNLSARQLSLDYAFLTSQGRQYNPFLYADYMPKIIQFIREREVVNPEATHEPSASANEDAIHSSAN